MSIKYTKLFAIEKFTIYTGKNVPDGPSPIISLNSVDDLEFKKSDGEKEKEGKSSYSPLKIFLSRNQFLAETGFI